MSRSIRLALSVVLVMLLQPRGALATPTSVVVTPSAGVQPAGLIHVNYDTYFSPTTVRSSAFPATAGVTVGVLPFHAVQLEVGLDLDLPSADPLSFNAKLGSPEDALFRGSPAIALGIFEAGITAETAIDALYAVASTATRLGTFSAGGYVGSSRLLRTPSGGTQRAGVLAAIVSPSFALHRSWLDAVEARWDVATGRNVLGATAVGLSFSFTPSVSFVTGPVYFFEPDLQPGGVPLVWTVQADIDLGSRPDRTAR